MTDPKDANKKEILRILDCVRTHYLDILDLPLQFTPDDLKKNYRKISILIHPDRCGSDLEEEAKTATAILNAAKEGLDNEEILAIWRNRIKTAEEEICELKSKELTEIKTNEAKKLGLDLRSDSLKVTHDDVRRHESYREWVGALIKDTLVAEEWEKKKLMMARAQAIKDKKEEAEKRQKAAQAEKAVEAEWEQNTDQRFNNWKSFTQNSSRLQRIRNRQYGPASTITKPPSFQSAFLEKSNQ